MAINYIRGNILAEDLVRGSNLSVQTSGLVDVLFIDVINGRVGVNTAATTHILTVNGNCNITTTLFANGVSASGNVTGNIGVFEDILVGNIDIGNIVNGGNLLVNSITSNTFVSATGNVQAGNVRTTGLISATGNITGGNLNTAGVASITGNVQAGNLRTTGLVSATGNVTGGNLTTAGVVSATGNIQGGNLRTTGLVSATGNVTGGNLTTSGNVSAAGTITASNFSGTGNISLGNITISNTTISTSLATGNITLKPTGTALAIIDTTTGLVVPVGNIAQRPGSPLTGTLRFNTETQRMEVYDGTEWDSVVSEVTNQILNGDNVTTLFTLDRATTEAAVLIMINGVVQLPGVAYTVIGNQLTFSQAPLVSDVIDIRFL